MYTSETMVTHFVLASRLLNRDKGNVMLYRGLIAVSSLILALSLTGCGERDQAKEDTDEMVSTSTETTTTSETTAPSEAPAAPEVKKEETATPAPEATTPEAPKAEEPAAAPAAAEEAPAQSNQ